MTTCPKCNSDKICEAGPGCPMDLPMYPGYYPVTDYHRDVLIERTVNLNEEDQIEITDQPIPRPDPPTWRARTVRPFMMPGKSWTIYEYYKSKILHFIARRLHRAAYRLEVWALPGKPHGYETLP